ncbi:MAG: IS66 family transposase [Lachnospiraceae bacterium]|nr:IS66 family transposase [Lachnospiraceae bacterium]
MGALFNSNGVKNRRLSTVISPTAKPMKSGVIASFLLYFPWMISSGGRYLSIAETEVKVNISAPVPERPLQDISAISHEQLVTLFEQQAETIGQLRATIANLSETVPYLTRKLYGRSREKLPIAGQIDLFGNIFGGDVQAEDTTMEPAPTPEEVLTPDSIQKPARGKRSKRKDLFDGVETEKIVVPIPDGDRTCNICGGEMEAVGREKVRSELQITPIQVKQVIYYREALACPNCKDEYGSFAYKKAETPPPLINHSMATPSAVSHLIFQKFVNAMTFYRMEQELKGMGVPLGRETMAAWIIFCALNILRPLYGLLFLEQKKRKILHGDETWCQALKEPNKTPESKSYIWLIVTGDDGLPMIVTYHYSPTRAHETAEELLDDYTGYFHTDKYDGYNCLETHITRCLCWAHGRRKWYEAITPGVRDRDRSKLKIKDLTPAEIGFLYCEKLFAIERKLKGLSPDEKIAKRLEKEKPVLESFWSWLETLTPLGGSKLEKAVNYFKGSREGFENYLKDGRCSISNNLAENQARPYVVGRKNFLFHNSTDGAEASAIIYSIVLTAKANNLDIHKYMEILLQRMPDYKNEPDGIRKLLPWSPEMQIECQRAKPGGRSEPISS